MLAIMYDETYEPMPLMKKTPTMPHAISAMPSSKTSFLSTIGLIRNA